MFLNIQEVKRTLEDAYDIPFNVKCGVSYGEPWYIIYPENSNEELFELTFVIKQKVRLVIEMKPQRYAAFSIKDMANASLNQRCIFVEYAKLLYEKKAKVNMFINQKKVSILHHEEWPNDWKSISCRISRSPILMEDEKFNPEKIVLDWAVIVVGMFLSLLNVVPIDGDENSHLEGRKYRSMINKYERNPFNRELCLAANGYDCKICGMNFEDKYGNIGRDFIHVHHITPISKMGGQYIIDPIKELIPVCPNCHAMLHKIDPPFLPEELKKILINNA